LCDCLSALLEKQLKREKKTRRQLQRRLSSVGVSSHGDGSHGDGEAGGHGRDTARSPKDNDKLGVSNDVPASSCHITGLSYQRYTLCPARMICNNLEYIVQL